MLHSITKCQMFFFCVSLMTMCGCINSSNWHLVNAMLNMTCCSFAYLDSLCMSCRIIWVGAHAWPAICNLDAHLWLTIALMQHVPSAKFKQRHAHPEGWDMGSEWMSYTRHADSNHTSLKSACNWTYRWALLTAIRLWALRELLVKLAIASIWPIIHVLTCMSCAVPAGPWVVLSTAFLAIAASLPWILLINWDTQLIYTWSR